MSKRLHSGETVTAMGDLYITTCDKILPCAHPCRKPENHPGDCGNADCPYLKYHTRSCGHQMLGACVGFDENLELPCQIKCMTKQRCGHHCTRVCFTCDGNCGPLLCDACQWLRERDLKAFKRQRRVHFAKTVATSEERNGSEMTMTESLDESEPNGTTEVEDFDSDESICSEDIENTLIPSIDSSDDGITVIIEETPKTRNTETTSAAAAPSCYKSESDESKTGSSSEQEMANTKGYDAHKSREEMAKFGLSPRHSSTDGDGTESQVDVDADVKFATMGEVVIKEEDEEDWSDDPGSFYVSKMASSKGSARTGLGLSSKKDEFESSNDLEVKAAAGVVKLSEAVEPGPPDVDSAIPGPSAGSRTSIKDLLLELEKRIVPEAPLTFTLHKWELPVYPNPTSEPMEDEIFLPEEDIDIFIKKYNQELDMARAKTEFLKSLAECLPGYDMNKWESSSEWGDRDSMESFSDSETEWEWDDWNEEGQEALNDLGQGQLEAVPGRGTGRFG